MFCLIISLMRITITGMLWHEILGIAVFVVFILHKLLNLNWIKAISKNIFSGKLNTKTKVTFFVDFLMLIATIFTAISGIGISKNVLIQFEFNDMQLWTIIHYISAYSLFALISIHLGMHLKAIISSIKKGLNIKNENGVSVIGRYIAIFFAIIGLIAYISDKKLVEIYDFFVNNNNNNTDTSNNSNTNSSNAIEEVSFENNDNNKYKLIAVDTSSTDATLEEKLSSTICTGCRKRCPLSNPQCGIGEQQAEKLITSYNSSKSSSSTTTDDSTSSSNSSTSNNNSNTDVEITNNVEESINDTTSQDSNTSGLSSDSSDENSTYTVNDLVPSETKNTTSSTTPGDITRSLLEMGFWIGSTYYIVEKLEKKKELKRTK